MTPSWYDVLGVAPDADVADIRAAWKAGVADLDPTDRRFRLLNKAAEVLLDEERRKSHDLELAAVEDDDLEETPETEAEDEGRSSGTAVPEYAEAVRARGVATSGETPSGQSTAGRTELVRTAVLGVVAVLLLIFTVISATGGGSGASAEGSSDALPDARDVAAARAAAEAGVVPVLSYDYRKLEQDKQAALSYMTPKYAAEYEQLFESVIAVNAPSTETVVTVDVLASGIVRTGEDLVDVLLFVNRPTTNKQQTTPEVYKDQATLRMRNVSGEWLVDCVISGSGSTCED